MGVYVVVTIIEMVVFRCVPSLEFHRIVWKRDEIYLLKLDDNVPIGTR